MKNYLHLTGGEMAQDQGKNCSKHPVILDLNLKLQKPIFSSNLLFE